MKLGLGARLAVAFAMLAAVTALVTAGVGSLSTSRQVNSDVDRFLRDRASDIAEGRRIDQALPDQGNNSQGGNNRTRGSERGNDRRNGAGNNRPADDATAQDEAIDQLLDIVESDADVQILDVDGNVMVSAGVALPVDDVDLIFLRDPKTPALRTVAINDEQYRMITRHIEGGGAVQVAQSLRGTNALLGDLRSELLLVGVAMSALAGLVGWFIASRTTRPLRALTRSVESVAASQDLATPIALARSDEIGQLSEEFESLLRTLDASRLQQHQLVQDAAHELRTPLTSVRANIDFLERATDLDATTRDSTLRSIKSELAHLSTILAEVVELATESRGSAGHERVDLATVAEEALAQFELRSARPVIRRLATSSIHGDHPALVRAVSNLIGNADKYSPAGLPIEVDVQNGELWVTDRGPGIPEAQREHIFDRFYRADHTRSTPGSGLGLAIVAKTIAEHHGRVWVRDRSPGVAVGFSLPAV